MCCFGVYVARLARVSFPVYARHGTQERVYFPGHEKHLSASVGNAGSRAPLPVAGDSAGALP